MVSLSNHDDYHVDIISAPFDKLRVTEIVLNNSKYLTPFKQKTLQGDRVIFVSDETLPISELVT